MEDCWLTALYESERARFFRIALRQTGRSDSAEDAVQAAFAAMMQLPTAPPNPVAYARKAVRNAAIDHYRRESVRRRREMESVVLGSAVDSAVSLESESDEIRDALMRLSVQDREVVELKLIEDMSFRQIAELTERPLQTVASRYRRAIDEIRTLVAETPHDERRCGLSPAAAMTSTDGASDIFIKVGHWRRRQEPARRP